MNRFEMDSTVHSLEEVGSYLLGLGYTEEEVLSLEGCERYEEANLLFQLNNEEALNSFT